MSLGSPPRVALQTAVHSRFDPETARWTVDVMHSEILVLGDALEELPLQLRETAQCILNHLQHQTGLTHDGLSWVPGRSTHALLNNWVSRGFDALERIAATHLRDLVVRHKLMRARLDANRRNLLSVEPHRRSIRQMQAARTKKSLSGVFSVVVATPVCNNTCPWPAVREQLTLPGTPQGVQETLDTVNKTFVGEGASSSGLLEPGRVFLRQLASVYRADPASATKAALAALLTLLQATLGAFPCVAHLLENQSAPQLVVALAESC